MPAPSPLSIAAGSVNRLVKEESYHRKELEEQKKRLEELRAATPADASYDDSFPVKQQERAVAETEAVFAPLLAKITDAVQKLEEQIALSESSGGASAEELGKAKTALASGRALVQKTEEAEGSAEEEKKE